MNDRHALVWTRSPVVVPDPPSNTTRSYIPTPLGKLEILSAQPSPSSPSSPRKKAILFQHGGFGHASVWDNYLTYFSKLGYPCYALSLRGHGASWKPSYLRMVWGYGKRDFAQDLGHALTWVSGVETGLRGGNFSSEDLVLIGHSAGGGLSQYFLSQGMGEVGALVICAGFPNFGGLGVYWNWFKNDPWFAPRYYIRDFWHSRSPLSSTTLVHRAFFSPEFPREEVKKWELYIPEYESMLWPLGMMLPFVNVWNVVKNITGWGKSKRLMVLAGEKDTLMGVTLMQQMAGIYRKTAAKTLKSRDQGKVDDGWADVDNIEFDVVSNAGHHIQNDLTWEEGAEKILGFLGQL
ncbi:Uncharacterized protein BP5553_05114 [Venustampulla echinocandica]|uniref:AB hydrolase-1 domain-containing protein n=1 Tax=Venustampulla echinocandica TaxID=2656787 RepID=A0A370TQ74_9HELO|nr:Uncharacterized protein BP5553_05114 [Venustampulla echinocandica]RDL37681.1 Uncharacterized protein BP5553_05114 [Venustampulla echinocandica]